MNNKYQSLFLIIFILLSIFIYYIYNFNKLDEKIESFSDNSNNIKCLCLLCLKPNNDTIDFLVKFKNKYDDYDVFLVIDDNSIQYSFNKLKVIQVEDKICGDAGFKYSNHMVKNNIPSAWDKFFYYFCNNNNYSNYWVLEEDVFIPNIETIFNIDKKYDNTSLLVKSNQIRDVKSSDEIFNWHHWKYIVDENRNAIFSLPWYKSMVCAVRIPFNLLDEVKKFVDKNSRLYFIEFFINTLAMKSNIRIESIAELSEIYWKKDFDIDDLTNNSKLYHPIKDVNIHKSIREFNNLQL